jgi:hypothetical protein
MYSFSLNHNWVPTHFALMLLLLSSGSCAAQNEISRIEFNSGSRTFRQQVIITPDSLVRIEENFRTNTKPVIEKRKITSSEWQSLISSLNGIKPQDIVDLKSPGDKRTYDAASHGSLILTTGAGESFSHGFDDTTPHQSLQTLMTRLLSLQ